MDSSILTEKTAGLPNAVWAGVALAGFFVLKRFIGGSTPTASTTTDTGGGAVPGSGGPAGVGPCPVISPVACGSGFTSQAGIDANGCPTLQCVPIGSTPGQCKFYTVYTVSANESLNDVAYAFSMSATQLEALNPYLIGYSWTQPGAYAGHDVIVDACLRGT